jgi:hypothetical protein
VKLEEKITVVVSCTQRLIDEHFFVSSFIEDGHLKFEIKNKHDHKVVLHANALKALIQKLQILLKELEK